ncbi:MAG: hydantoinase [Acidiferrobacteraceae bacterium]|nr:hydantoinase [Acidiferrobacteraceae bacterium]
MTKYLGIDTGGTYTDAIVFDPASGVLGSEKSLTTKQDLTIGINSALSKVLQSVTNTRDIELVSLSTTLATNAIVEGKETPVCLILIGQTRDVLERYGLGSVLGSDPVVFVDGGHTYSGEEKIALDEGALISEIERVRQEVNAFVVVSSFGVQNPTHELRAREILRLHTKAPVTCSHELTNRLNAPRRAVTSVLNARLIPLIDHLINAVTDLLHEHAINAPLMIVQGDGSLVSVDVARLQPIQTILSGPAASVVGAAYLTKAKDAIIADIGGTTTDIALLKDGRPGTHPDGPLFSNYRMMINAAAVKTIGLGGDSEFSEDANGNWSIGPNRAVPLSLLGMQHPKIVATLKKQSEASELKKYYGYFVVKEDILGNEDRQLNSAVTTLLEFLGNEPVALQEVLERREFFLPYRALRKRGILNISSFTPSDAAHVLGIHEQWSTEAARFGAKIAFRKLHHGAAPTSNIEEFCRELVEFMTYRCGQTLINFCLEREGAVRGLVSKNSSDDSVFLRKALKPTDSKQSLIDIAFHLKIPVIAVGAPAKAYYPLVTNRMNADVIIPEYADVCNAVGAVVSGVVQKAEGKITSPVRGVYRFHWIEGVEDFNKLDEAVSFASSALESLAIDKARVAGSDLVDVQITRDDRVSRLADGGLGGLGETGTVFIESKIVATAAGRPSLN